MADDIDDDAVLRRLWASVIIQHLIDATCIPTSPAAHVHKRQARAWFITEVGTTAQDFEEVCMSANVDHERVRAFVREYDGPPLTAQALSRMRDAILTRSLAIETNN